VRDLARFNRLHPTGARAPLIPDRTVDPEADEPAQHQDIRRLLDQLAFGPGQDQASRAANEAVGRGLACYGHPSLMGMI